MRKDSKHFIPTEVGIKSSLFEQLVENVHEVFWVCSGDGLKVLFASRSYEKIWGRTLESLYSNSLDWIKAIHSLDSERIKATFLNIRETKSFDHEYRIVRPDTEIRWIRDRGYLVYDEEENDLRVVGIAQDVTHYKMLEVESENHLHLMEQKNLALKEVLNMFQLQKQEMEEKIKANVSSFVLPIINQMKVTKSFQLKLIERLESGIRSLLNASQSEKKELSQSLSGKELEVANLIRMGHSTKEIASLLNLSTNTITTYRYRMRSKLGIKWNKVGLVDHLKKTSG